MKEYMNKITGIISNICRIWIDETRRIFRDEGLLIFTILLPLLYPLLYSWIYNNEVVRDVPVALVDNSNSKLSRELASKLDASPDVQIAYRCGNLEEAQRLSDCRMSMVLCIYPRTSTRASTVWNRPR